MKKSEVKYIAELEAGNLALQAQLDLSEKALENAKEKSLTLSDDRKRALGVIFKQKAQLEAAEKERDKFKGIISDSKYLIKWLADNHCECDEDVGMAPCEAHKWLDIFTEALTKKEG